MLVDLFGPHAVCQYMPHSYLFFFKKKTKKQIIVKHFRLNINKVCFFRAFAPTCVSSVYMQVIVGCILSKDIGSVCKLITSLLVSLD